MDMSTAIHDAVWAQLTSDHKPRPTGTETMGPTYLYDKNSLPIFLRMVSNKLAAGHPRYNFDWTTLNIDTCLADTPADLCIYIAQATT